MEYSNLFVCLMGIGIVFIGLICIIILVSLVSRIVQKIDKNDSAKASVPSAVTENKAKVTPELVAAISACIAEELGTAVNAIRIKSIKKI